MELMKPVSSRLAVGLLAVAALVPTHDSSAQVTPGDPETNQEQWSLPFALTSMTGQGEIAHAILLPPPVADSSLSESERLGNTRVVFICRPGCQAKTDRKVFLWRPTRPYAATPLHVSPGPQDGSADLFCSGHATLGDGSVLFAGGLNYVAKCAEGTCTDTDPNEEHHRAVGHEFAHRLQTGLETPAWATQASVMNRERYYPTVMTD